MADRSTIEWTDATWNPITGCTKVSPGCDHCYAETFAERFRGVPGHHFEQGFDVVLRPERLDQPLRWKKPRRVFVNSMSDLFHEAIPDEYIARVFAVMLLARQHAFQVLTKRHGRMRSLLNDPQFLAVISLEGLRFGDSPIGGPWPLPNLWLGVSVEDQKWADIRIPTLRDTPAAVRMLSCEPLLGPLAIDLDGIGWVICGGESGPGARPMHPDWARGLRDQCAAASVPFFFKQHGEHLAVPIEDDPQFSGGRAFNVPGGGRAAATIRELSTKAFHSGRSRPLRAGDRNGHGVMLDDDTIAVRVGKKRAGRELDGRTWDEYPQVVTQ